MEIIDNRVTDTISSKRENVIVKGSIVSIQRWNIGISITLNTGYDVVMTAAEVKQIMEDKDKS